MRPVLLVIIGLLVGVLGAAPIIGLLQADQSEQATAAPTEVTIVATPSSLPERDPQPVEELSESVSKLLMDRGPVQEVGLNELNGSLPDAVVRLLIDRNAVLAIPETAENTP